MGSIDKDTSTDLDIVLIGAGISGINAAYRIQTRLPNYKYTILESRGAIGGTWDLFRYPGIRSDSDLHTFGFRWRPWHDQKVIASGDSIRTYIRESAQEYGIDRNIHFNHKLLSADWSSEKQIWTLKVDAEGEKTTYTARFVVFGTGYYDYNQALETHIPGLENFKGKIIHPQFWPEDLDYKGKKMIIIGSGATAVTILPVIASTAEKVTMLQRSPGYIISQPSVDPIGKLARRWLPEKWAFKVVRWKFLVLPLLFFKFCRAFPNAAKRALRRQTSRQIPQGMALDPNFNPRYRPWEQRLCVCPDGDFFAALRSGKADIVTDMIETVTDHSIVTKNGTTLEADIIVTATGLKMQIAGGARISVDGKPVVYPERFVWKSTMLQDVPNAALVIGYTNASWTLGADIAANLVCRLCKYMDSNNKTSATPTVKEGSTMQAENFLNLNSTYIEKAKGEIPKAGDQVPWKAKSSYFMDRWEAERGLITTGLHFEPSEHKKDL